MRSQKGREATGILTRGSPRRFVSLINAHKPRMRLEDGCLVPSVIRQALLGEPLSVYGDGSETRSVQDVEDLIEGVARQMTSQQRPLVNIENPAEYMVRGVASLILGFSGSSGGLDYEPLPEDHSPAALSQSALRERVTRVPLNGGASLVRFCIASNSSPGGTISLLMTPWQPAKGKLFGFAGAECDALEYL